MTFTEAVIKQINRLNDRGDKTYLTSFAATAMGDDYVIRLLEKAVDRAIEWRKYRDDAEDACPYCGPTDHTDHADHTDHIKENQ